MPIETIVAAVGKSDPAFDLQADIIFDGNFGAKINKLLDCIKNIVIGLVSTCRLHILRFTLIYCQSHLGRLSFNSTKNSSYISLDMPYDVDVVSKFLDTLQCIAAFRSTLSISKLKKKPCAVSNDSKRSFPTMTELQELLNVILHSLINFAGIPSLDIVVNIRFLMGLSKAAL